MDFHIFSFVLYFKPLYLSHDRIVKLHFTFQDDHYLYMVMELARSGEMLDMIRLKKQLNGNPHLACDLLTTQYYLAGREMVDEMVDCGWW